MNYPLEDLLVLDFTQFLSGPSATLRLRDMGARVIKIEHFEKGDLSRSIYAQQHNIGDASAFYQAINRGKESVAANLKDVEDLKLIHKLIEQADIVVHNFRPNVMKRLGLDYDAVKAIKPTIVYGEISGYGSKGPWQDKPGQDLLVQAVSGLTGMSGQESNGPVPIGVAIADILAGAQLVQGLLAALLMEDGAHVEISMLEAMLDFQFEPVTLYYQDGEPVNRGEVNGAHPLVGAPYGLYKTADGFLSLAMGSITKIGELIDCEGLKAFPEPATWFAQRDEIKTIIAAHLPTQTTQYWLDRLEPADIWCAQVMNWEDLINHDGFKVLDIVKTVQLSNGDSYKTTGCPIKIDEVRLNSNNLGAPQLGEHTQAIFQEFTNRG